MGTAEFQHFLISDREFNYLRELIYREAGINLTEAKKCLVQTRIGKLMRRNNIDGYDQLFKVLENDPQGDMLVTVLDSISTNHTFFFREDAHFSYLQDVIVPEMLAGNPSKKLALWSSACSSGEEPYSIAITLSEVLEKKFPQADYSILATDISTKVLEQAQNGVYPMEVIESIPLELKKKYFQRGRNANSDKAKVKDFLRAKIGYSRHNLLYVLDQNVTFDIVFCRNVMIYFDYQTKEKVVKNIFQKIKPGGYFITGHSESLSVIDHPFKQIKPTIYRKI